MLSKKLRSAIAALSAMAALSMGVGLAPAFAEVGESARSTCHLVADTPTFRSGQARAHGGRDGCTGTVSWVEVKLIHVQAGPAPDMTMKTQRRTHVGNAQWYATNPSSAGKVYRTLVRSSTGASSQSGTASAP